MNVAVPALDWASTDDKRVFGKVASIYSGPDYEIQTKYDCYRTILPILQFLIISDRVMNKAS